VCRSSFIAVTAQTMLLDDAESHGGRDQSKREAEYATTKYVPCNQARCPVRFPCR
jgi:hypothetical protein